MKDFRIIVTDNRQDFELKIKRNLNENYKMINSNLSTVTPYQNETKTFLYGVKAKLYFYAYMEKETEE